MHANIIRKLCDLYLPLPYRFVHGHFQQRWIWIELKTRCWCRFCYLSEMCCRVFHHDRVNKNRSDIFPVDPGKSWSHVAAQFITNKRSTISICWATHCGYKIWKFYAIPTCKYIVHTRVIQWFIYIPLLRLSAFFARLFMLFCPISLAHSLETKQKKNRNKKK